MSNRRRLRRTRPRPATSPRASSGPSAFGLASGRTAPRHDEAAAHSRLSASDVRELIEAAVYLCEREPARVVEPVLSSLLRVSAAAAEPASDPRHVIGEDALALLSGRWEAGWQPADLAHYLRRATPKLDDVGAAAIREWHRRRPAAPEPPDEWRRQVEALPEPSAAGQGRGRAAWLFGVDADAARGMRRALLLIGRLRSAAPQTPLGPPPSRWGAAAGDRPQAGRSRAAGVPDRLLDRVRALLAKAESTDFAAEADALTAKAQELIARHAIDEAMLRGEASESLQVAARRLHLDDPYAEAKASLVHAVAAANRVRAVWDPRLGAATVVGLPEDLERVELLFTSLLVQATREMTLAGDGAASGASRRSASFRRSFLLAFAARVGQRLAEAADRVAQEYSTDLVPTFERERAAVDAETDRLFPDLVSRGTRTVDPSGWRAGTAAAEQAVFPAGRLG